MYTKPPFPAHSPSGGMPLKGCLHSRLKADLRGWLEQQVGLVVSRETLQKTIHSGSLVPKNMFAPIVGMVHGFNHQPQGSTLCSFSAKLRNQLSSTIHAQAIPSKGCTSLLAISHQIAIQKNTDLWQRIYIYILFSCSCATLWLPHSQQWLKCKVAGLHTTREGLHQSQTRGKGFTHITKPNFSMRLAACQWQKVGSMSLRELWRLFKTRCCNKPQASVFFIH